MAAVAKTKEFRTKQSDFGKIDQRFHTFKNSYPYFGFVDVEVEGAGFIMFIGNDDLVALTYFWYGPSSYETYSLALWSQFAKGSSTILDIGAYTGVYSLAAAEHEPTANITAFEPARRTHGRLLLNVQANNLTERVTTEALGIADRDRHALINQYRGDNILGSGDSIIEKDITAYRREEQISLVALDNYVGTHDLKPDLLKIDVEEAEVLALKGMDDTLSSYRPRIIIEVVPGTLDEVTSVFGRHGYRLWRIDERQRKLLEPDSIPGTVNLLAEPA